MKIDLRKAYDTVNWDFLRDVLSGLGFPGLFVEWIMPCVSTTTFSISIKGVLHGFFRGQQGLRQEDPYLPSIFDMLRILIEEVGESQNFGECSGLCISPNKYNLFMTGISREDAEEIKTITGFSLGRFPFRYLGIPVAASRLSIEQFSPLISKIAREQNYLVMQKLSMGGNAMVLKKPLVAWKDVCCPKSEGGLGFIDLHAWNLALLSKSLWNLQFKKDPLGMISKLVLIRNEIVTLEGLTQTALERVHQWAATEARATSVQAIAKKVGFTCTVYCIWKTRNARIFEGKILHPTGIIRDIKIQVYRNLHASFPNLREL
ncbi:hypothetical protein Acr_28g0003890 [Actinidia rufa]|uniref:Reverse transcriptase domain-containing protein n=1 Tax=Actinidia rufa TaxID=165716 RepID=A0A7J0HAC0_9ERIC|nr:hypothetical protein Acr_28g0003890 [Actinidia rufa]